MATNKTARVRIDLAYKQVECGGCGAARVSGVPCPDCGHSPAPHEADSDKQVRQRRARLARRLLGGSTPIRDEAPMGDPTGVFDALEDVVGAFLQALVAAVDPSPGRNDALSAPIEEFRRLRANVAASARRRPWIQTWRMVDELVSLITEMMDHFLLAIESATPQEAQQSAERAQRSLDVATHALDDLHSRLVLAERLADAAPAQALQLLAEEAFGRAGGSDVNALNSLGRPLYERLTGDLDMEPGSGVGLVLTDVQAEFLLDPDRLWRVAGEVFRYATDRGTRFSTAVQDPHWAREFHRSIGAMHDAALDFRVLAPAAQRDQDVVRAFLTLAQDLHESARALLATLVALKGNAPVSKWLSSDTADLVRVLDQRGLGGWVGGLSPAIRHARAHLRFTIEDDGIHLQKGDGFEDVIPTDVLVDNVLAAQESLLALTTGVVHAAAHLGADISEFDVLLSLGLAVEEVVPIILGFFGYDDTIAVVEQGDHLVIDVRNLNPGVGTLSVVAGLVPYLPSAIETMELRATNNAAGVLAGPLEPFRTSSETSDDVDRQLAVVRAARRWTVEGDPVLSRDYARKLVAMFASGALSESPAAMVRSIRRLRDYCKNLDDAEMAESLEALLRVQRAHLLGQPPAASDIGGMSLVSHWERAKLPSTGT